MFGNHEIAVDQDSAVVTKEMWSTMRQTLAAQPAPVQEPVAWMHKETGLLRQANKAKGGDFEPNHWTPLYTTPPAAQRQWVGLTDEEYFEIGQRHWVTSTKIELIHAEIEAKLREKNT
jgi:hypothetical protein